MAFIKMASKWPTKTEIINGFKRKNIVLNNFMNVGDKSLQKSDIYGQHLKVPLNDLQKDLNEVVQ